MMTAYMERYLFVWHSETFSIDLFCVRDNCLGEFETFKRESESVVCVALL